MSILALAERSGITRGTIYGIEKGNHWPFGQTIRALAKALGVKPKEIEF